jgi:hypothetical protein
VNTTPHANVPPQPSAGLPDSESHQQFAAALRESLGRATLNRLMLGKYRGPEAGLERVIGRLVTLRGTAQLSLVLRYRTRDVTKNLPLHAAAGEVIALIGQGFRHAHLVTASEDIQLAANRRGEFRLQRGRLAAAPSVEADAFEHDREKRRLLTLDRPFLAALGITTDDGRLVPAMARKWKQVNKFLEIVDHAIDSAGLGDKAEIRVLDFGAGKGYLTFAVHDYLTHVRGIRARVTGVELRPDLVEFCNAAAVRAGAEGLAFEAGSLKDRAGTDESADILIALHACDTATDEAMSLGVRAGAAIILCSPCCHKELRPQMTSPLALRPVFRHGIHLGQEAEMVTDSLRALLLESEGYDTQVFEFVSLEHTSKNKMILASRRTAPSPGREAALVQVGEIKTFYGIREQHLESLLRAAPQPAAVPPG